MSETDNENQESQGFRPDLLRTGMFFASRFRIVHSLGDGSMGKVYLATDLMLGEGKIALKILSSDLQNDKAHLARFLREVQLTREVTHPAVVRTYDIGHYADCHYFTMEYVEGKTLHEMLSEQPCSPQKCIDIMSQLCDGLSAIHAKGIVHRDLKSSNVLITPQGRIKIADFGIARSEVSNLTIPHELIGSATHIAPEIWKQTKVTHSCDLYSLGIILYELLTGKLPFDGKTAYALMWKHLKDEPIAPVKINPQVPDWLSSLCLALLCKDSSGRPASAAKILQILKANDKSDDASEKVPKSTATEIIRPQMVTMKYIPSSSSIDIWSPANPSAQTPGGHSSNKSISKLRALLDTAAQNSSLVKESIRIIDYQPSEATSRKLKELPVLLKRAGVSLLETSALIFLLLTAAKYTPAFLAFIFAGSSLLRGALGDLIYALMLIGILLSPFYFICSLNAGMRRALMCLSKISAAAYSIFLLMFAGNLLNISISSTSSSYKDHLAEAKAAVEVTFVNLSEMLTLQISPTAFSARPSANSSSYIMELSGPPSTFQHCIHLGGMLIILLFGTAIACDTKNRRLSYFKGYFYLIPVAVTLLLNSVSAGFESSVEGWNLVLGSEIIPMRESALLLMGSVWASVLVCALVTYGWRFRVRG